MADLRMQILHVLEEAMGKATWEYDADLDLHIPCCSRLRVMTGVRRPDGTPVIWRCGNGPLADYAIASGDCGEHEGTREEDNSRLT